VGVLPIRVRNECEVGGLFRAGVEMSAIHLAPAANAGCGLIVRSIRIGVANEVRASTSFVAATGRCLRACEVSFVALRCLRAVGAAGQAVSVGWAFWRFGGADRCCRSWRLSRILAVSRNVGCVLSVAVLCLVAVVGVAVGCICGR
jgi:hypothetical protein